MKLFKDKNKPCIICGKPTTGRYFINYDNAAGKIIPQDARPEHGEYGFLNIGAECRKKAPKGWVITDNSTT